MIMWRLSSLIPRILLKRDSAIPSFFKLQHSYLVIMNTDDIEIDIERFIYEIQIKPGIRDLADAA